MGKYFHVWRQPSAAGAVAKSSLFSELFVSVDGWKFHAFPSLVSEFLLSVSLNRMQSSLKEKTLSGLFWQFLQKILGQLFSFVVTVVLARLLMPEDYGVVALASMFNVLVGIFISGSMDAALIQKKDADELDYNTVFFSSFVMSFVIYAVVYFGAPFFARLYHNDLITPIMRVLALTMPIGALTMVQNAIVSRQMAFRKLFYTSLIGQVLAAMLGIYMAYTGYGPWALVAQQIFGTLSGATVLFVVVPWRPRLAFSWVRFLVLFNFAWKKTAAGFIGTLCGQLKGYLIGFRYSAADLAYYDRGEGLPAMLNNNVLGTINTVIFPVMSQLQGDVEAVKQATRRSMMTSSYILSPMFLGLAAVAEKAVPLLYSERWEPTVPFMQVACFTCCVTVLNSNLQSILAIGKSAAVLKLEIYKKPVMVLLVFIGINFGPIGISIAIFFYSVYVFFMNTLPNRKYLHYTFKEQIVDVGGGLTLAAVMSLLVNLLGSCFTCDWLALLVQIPTGVILYLFLSELIRPKAYLYVRQMVAEKVQQLYCQS